MPDPTPDPVADILTKGGIPKAVSADAWDAFHAATSTDDLTGRLKTMALPQPVKAQLWDLKNSQAQTTAPAQTQPAASSAGLPSLKPYLTVGGIAADAAAPIVGGTVGGFPGAVLGGAAGEGYRQLIQHADEIWPAMKDVGSNLISHPVETLKGFAQGATEGAKNAITSGVISGVGQGAFDTLPSTARAGQNFQAVMGAAKDVPVNTQEMGNVALRIADLAQHGGGTNWGPAPVRQLTQYLTDPKKPALTYEVARDFASNISRLSANEMSKLPPNMLREVINLRVALNEANAQAANVAGKGAEYASAMNEYARAKNMRETIDFLMQKGLPFTGALGGAVWAGQKALNYLKE